VSTAPPERSRRDRWLAAVVDCCAGTRVSWGVLSESERQRYARQLILEGFGPAAQERLKGARAFVAGAGGLGSALGLYLTAAGIGALRFADHGAVELSNLNRQILYATDDVGHPKVERLARSLAALNPGTVIETSADTIREESVPGLLAGCDVVIDALDNLPTRYLLNRAAQAARLPLFHGAVYGFDGQAMTVLPGRSACLMCLYNSAKVEGIVPLIGTSPAVIGCIEATEVIKFLTGMGDLLTDRLLLYDGLAMSFREVAIRRDPGCPHCGRP
jgi:molybdopterin/thiamine biosynthesis adenylyltransferase